MIIHLSRLFFLLCFVQPSWAQQTYFQQNLHYHLDVHLDDTQHTLRGTETIQYKNNSADTLRYILMHLWANALSDDQSEYTRQEVENGNTAFYFSKTEQRAAYDSLQFRVNQEVVEVSQYNNYQDVWKLQLNQPLLPGASLEISTPFKLKLPETFSRFGHTGQHYHITQWFPKPAVYDINGWHPLPYLEQGEFYSEYGTFDVRINVPANYVVMATGELQNKDEIIWLRNRAQWADSVKASFPLKVPSDTSRKTLHFIQDKVHDFAWFADKRFQLSQSLIRLDSGKEVLCQSVWFPENKALYKNSDSILAQSVLYLSRWLGSYAYSVVNIVDGSHAAPDGMEYPMIAILGHTGSLRDLLEVIMHEVAHNWFYGMVGSDERNHPWMDESITSYYEQRLMSTLYPGIYSEGTRFALRMNRQMDRTFLYHLAAAHHTDQAMNLHAAAFTSSNYGAIVYQKGCRVIQYLEAALGQPVFDSMMKQYVSDWSFRHPQPDDFISYVERFGNQDMQWFAKDLLAGTTRIDPSLGKVKRKGDSLYIHINHAKNFNGPIPLSAWSGDSIQETRWFKVSDLPEIIWADPGRQITRLEIDALHQTTDLNRTNNNWYKKGLFNRRKPGAGIGLGLGQSKRKNIYLAYALGYNRYDQFISGIVVNNLNIPNKPFQFAFVPMFAWGSRSLVGSGFVSYSLFPRRQIQELMLSIPFRSYHHRSSDLNRDGKTVFLRHVRYSPTLDFLFRKPEPRSPLIRSLQVQYNLMHEQHFRFEQLPDSSFRVSADGYKTRHLINLNYQHIIDRTFNPYQWQTRVSGNHQFVKLTAEARIRMNYHLENKGFHARLFGGKFFDFKHPGTDPFALQNNFLNTTYTGANDVNYQENMFGRNEQKGWMSQQIIMQEGGFKLPTPFLAQPYGQTDDWLLSMNVRSDLPFDLPLKIQVYADVATFARATRLLPSGNRFLFTGGLEWHLLKDLLVIYSPLLMSQDYKQYVQSTFPKNRFWNTLSFSLQLHKISWTRSQKLLSWL